MFYVLLYTCHCADSLFSKVIRSCQLRTDENQYVSDTICLVYRTVFRIQEPSSFGTDWYFHKFKRSGLRYEAAISKPVGHIVHVNGPYRCRHWPDSNIFACQLKKLFLLGKMVLANNRYCTDLCVTSQNVMVSERNLYTQQRAQREACSARLECFNILQRFQAYRFLALK